MSLPHRDTTDGGILARGAVGDRATVNVLSSEGRMADSLASGQRIRAACRDGVAVGTFLIELPSAGTVRALALAGLDFVVLDLEHSSFGFETLGALLAEARALDLPALVRVLAGEPGSIGKVLDMGAAGVVVPHVSSAQAAKHVVDAARYSPRGHRGYAPLIGYAVAPEGQARAGDDPVICVQIEGCDGVRDAGEIAGVDGIDVMFVGPFDLSQAIGKPGEIDCPEVAVAAEKVAAACPPDRVPGIYIHDPSRAGQWARLGFRFQCVGFDGALLLSAARSLAAAARTTLETAVT